MAFDEVRLPLAVGYGASGGPGFKTEIVALANGFERRNQAWAQARRRYDAASGLVSARDAAALTGFFQARAGRARGFRLKDWADYSSAADGKAGPGFEDQWIGTGDGVGVAFQLVKTYGAEEPFYVRPIKKPVAGTVCVGVDGVAYETGWSVDVTSGVVTFAQAPAVGCRITAGFLFDVPVRFDTDRLSVLAPDGALAKAEIPLVEVRV